MTVASMVGSRFSVLLTLVAVLVVSGSLGGCAGSTDSDRVTIIGPWVGAEELLVRQMLEVFEQQTGIQVDYSGTSAVDQVLQAAVQEGSPPDVAVLPSLGDAAKYRAGLKRLDGIVADEWSHDYSPQWQHLARAGMDGLYTIPAKVDLKGLVWFTSKHPPRQVPRTFEELMAFGRDVAAGGATPWCMGVSAQSTSGWPGTDWIETILLRRSGVDVYQQWATGQLSWTAPEVRQAWTTWGQVVAEPGQVRGGSMAALLTEFGDAARPMFADEPGCLMEHQASFISGYYSGYDGAPTRGTDFDFFPFPPFGGAHADTAGEPRAVAADMASMFNDTPQARALMKFLVSEQAQRQWPAAALYSASTRVPAAEYEPFDRRIATELTGTAPLCFDASDLMPTTMRSAFYRAVLEYLSDPGRLDLLLGELDQVRTGIPGDHWLTAACAR
jgi:alpha-glucoside transport system substrate-binding protein